MPLAKIHVVEGRTTRAGWPRCLAHSSALMNTLRVLTLYEAPGENFSFGQGEAQRANAVLRERK
jgi:hypothetical protein